VYVKDVNACVFANVDFDGSVKGHLFRQKRRGNLGSAKPKGIIR
jgi:hypothetical protein